MSKFYYQHTVSPDSGESLTIFFGENGEGAIEQVLNDHPDYAEILSIVLDPENETTEAELLALININIKIGTKLTRLSERVSYDGRNVYFDGDMLANEVSAHILRMLEESNPQLRAVVNFLEKVSSNPSENSRTSLYTWLRDRDFTLTPDGDFIAYKGVKIDSDGVSVSIHAGPAIVDGLAMNGHVPNKTGSVIEMARSTVDPDTLVGCSTGLHAGTWNYAHNFARGRTLRVQINPRDVVSVPEHCEFQKLRVSRYVVLEETEAPDTLPVVFSDDYYDDDEDDWGYDDEEDDDDREDGYGDWTPEDIDAWESAGFDEEDAQYYVDNGYSVDEALSSEGHSATGEVADRDSEEELDSDAPDCEDEVAVVRFLVLDAEDAPAETKSKKKGKNKKKNKKKNKS